MLHHDITYTMKSKKSNVELIEPEGQKVVVRGWGWRK